MTYFRLNAARFLLLTLTHPNPSVEEIDELALQKISKYFFWKTFFSSAFLTVIIINMSIVTLKHKML